MGCVPIALHEDRRLTAWPNAHRAADVSGDRRGRWPVNMMDHHRFRWPDLSFLVSSVLFPLAITVLVLLVVCVVAYGALRRFRRDRVRSSTPAVLLGPRRQRLLAQLKARLDRALATARGTVDAVDAGEATRRDLDAPLCRLEDLGGRLGGELERIDLHVSDDGAARILAILAARVDELEDLTDQIIDAVGTAVSAAAHVELRDIDAELSGALDRLDFRMAALQELSSTSADDKTRRPSL